jgi:hypothetical protein
MAPESWLALAHFVTSRIIAAILHLNMNGLHVVLQVILFVKYFLAHNTGKLATPGGQNLNFHVGVQQGCKKTGKIFCVAFNSYPCHDENLYEKNGISRTQLVLRLNMKKEKKPGRT